MTTARDRTLSTMRARGYMTCRPEDPEYALDPEANDLANRRGYWEAIDPALAAAHVASLEAFLGRALDEHEIETLVADVMRRVREHEELLDALLGKGALLNLLRDCGHEGAGSQYMDRTNPEVDRRRAAYEAEQAARRTKAGLRGAFVAETRERMD